jgi:hypothetical protein
MRQSATTPARARTKAIMFELKQKTWSSSEDIFSGDADFQEVSK